MVSRATKSGHRPDLFLLAVVFALTIAGIVILVSASSELGKIKFNDSYYYFKHQLLNGLSIGVLGFIAAYFINYQWYRKLALPLFIVNLILLALVFTEFGVTAGGASRWLTFGPIGFQPAELLKLTFIMYLAAWFGGKTRGRRDERGWGGFVVFLLMSGLVAVLLVLQPTTSMVVILMGAGLAIYFLSDAPWRYIIAYFLLGVIGIGTLVFTTPYRRERVLTFLNPTRNEQSTSFHANEAKTIIGSGGLTGIGYGESKEKVRTLPAPIDDSIFAVAAQELGFAGAGVLVALFALFAIRSFLLAKKVRDRFGQLLLVGFASVVALQSIVHIGAISGSIPLTGVPLPFVSYGGTALMVFLTMSGIITNISKYA